jgi:hypothetical protein
MGRNQNDVQNKLYRKQDKLTAGYGLSISQDNVISYILGDSIYIIVDQLPDVSEAHPNKIYILEVENNG